MAILPYWTLDQKFSLGHLSITWQRHFLSQCYSPPLNINGKGKPYKGLWSYPGGNNDTPCYCMLSKCNKLQYNESPGFLSDSSFFFFFLSNSNLLRLHGNPADYAWGAEGLDSIITQVREQRKEKVLLSVNTLSLVWPQITRMVVKGSIVTRKKAKQKWNENLSKLKKNYGLVYDPKWKKLCKRHVN